MAKHGVTTSCFKDACLSIFDQCDLEAFIKMVTLLDRFGNYYRLQVGDGSANESNLALYHNYGKRSGPH